MKRAPITLFVAVLWLVSAADSLYCQENKFDDRLLGKWQSDKERNMAWVRENRCCGSERCEKFMEDIYGKLILEFTRKEVVASWQGLQGEHHGPLWKIVYVGEDFDVILSKDPITNKDRASLIIFEGKNEMSTNDVHRMSKEYWKKID
jgi:hypothetical protein